MPLLRPKIVKGTIPVGFVETPVIQLLDVPNSVEVGDNFTPRVIVLRADGVTPVPNARVDFFVLAGGESSLLGDRVLTDVNGEAQATEPYWVGGPLAGQDIRVVVVVRRTII